MLKYIFKTGIFTLVFLIGLGGCFLSVQAAEGAEGVEGAGGAEGEYVDSIDNPITSNSFTGLFIGVTNWIVGIIASLATLMIVIGGMQYLFSGGNEEKVKKANKTILYAVIGLVVVGASWGLLQALLGILGFK